MAGGHFVFPAPISRAFVQVVERDRKIDPDTKPAPTAIAPPEDGLSVILAARVYAKTLLCGKYAKLSRAKPSARDC